jgi:hypothetical protein
MLEPMAAQAVQLKQMQTQWSALSWTAQSGHLRMETGVAEQAVRRCEDMANITTSSLQGRDSVSFATNDPNSCYVAVTSQASGSPAVVVHAWLKFASIGKVDPCPIATDVSAKLVPLLP